MDQQATDNPGDCSLKADTKRLTRLDRLRGLESLRRYLRCTGTYPVGYPIRTPLGAHVLTLWSPHDFRTLNEIFCRHDYLVEPAPTVIVDLGSNIGVSAAFFLSRRTDAFVYCVEALPSNVVRLRQNLKAFEGRYSVREQAVDLTSGTVRFGVEATGRYGGIGLDHPDVLEVEAVSLDQVLADALADHEEIDLLKIDVEGLEESLIRGLDPSHRPRIRNVLAECQGDPSWCPGFHFEQRGSIASWRRIDSAC